MKWLFQYVKGHSCLVWVKKGRGAYPGARIVLGVVDHNVVFWEEHVDVAALRSITVSSRQHEED